MMVSDKEFIKSLNIEGKILDIGSLDVNGNIKEYCKGFYIGIDIRNGKNVNIQATSHFLPFKSETFDNVISIGTFEHDQEFWSSLKEIWRVLKIGGRFILSIPDYKFNYHPYPKDYWRFSLDTLNLFFNGEYTIWKSNNKDNCIRVWGIK